MNIDFSYSGELAEIAIIGNFLDFIATFFLAFAIILLVVSIYQIIVMWRIFSKAGKPGWASLIPIYNTIVLFQICGLSPYLLLLIMIPIVGWIVLLIMSIVAQFKLAKAFGKPGIFGVGLLLLNIVFLSILAFDSSEYVGIENE